MIAAETLTSLSPIEHQIVAQRKSFDLLALLRLLHSLGNRPIWYESHNTFTSEDHVIHNIIFHKDVIILVLNIGLLSAQTPLPSYILNMRDSHVENVHDFERFLHFFDHILIQNYIQSNFPEFNPLFTSEHAPYAVDQLSLCNLKAPRTLHYLFSAVFPECDVYLEHIQSSKWSSVRRTRLGSIQLGNRYHLGDEIPKKFSGIRIILKNSEGYIYINEIQKRLQQLALPVLQHKSLYLEVQLVGKMQPIHMGEPTTLGFKKVLDTQKNGQITLFANTTFRNEEKHVNPSI